jgi:hypothetical protein
MAEPHSTAIGVGLAFGTVTLTGTIFGMHYDALGIGFVAALVALLHMPPRDGQSRTPWRVFSLVAGASFLAGVFAPATAQAATAYLPWVAAMGPDLLRVTSAAVIGASANVVIPLGFAWLARKAGEQA